MATDGGSLQRSAALRAVVLIGVVGLLVAYARPAGAPPPPEGPIVFESTEGGRRDIWVMQADGSGKVNLTDDRIRGTRRDSAGLPSSARSNRADRAAAPHGPVRFAVSARAASRVAPHSRAIPAA